MRKFACHFLSPSPTFRLLVFWMVIVANRLEVTESTVTFRACQETEAESLLPNFLNIIIPFNILTQRVYHFGQLPRWTSPSAPVPFSGESHLALAHPLARKRDVGHLAVLSAIERKAEAGSSESPP